MGKSQFGLNRLFSVITVACVLFATFGIPGRAAIWVIIQICATGTILALTKGRTWRGAKIGFFVGACIASLLLFTQEISDASMRRALLLWMGTFGGWVGAAAHGVAADRAECVIAFLAAFLWAIAVLVSM